jgi:hypothetical protein
LGPASLEPLDELELAPELLEPASASIPPELPLLPLEPLLPEPLLLEPPLLLPLERPPLELEPELVPLDPPDLVPLELFDAEPLELVEPLGVPVPLSSPKPLLSGGGGGLLHPSAEAQRNSPPTIQRACVRRAMTTSKSTVHLLPFANHDEWNRHSRDDL